MYTCTFTHVQTINSEIPFVIHPTATLVVVKIYEWQQNICKVMRVCVCVCIFRLELYRKNNSNNKYEKHNRLNVEYIFIHFLKFFITMVTTVLLERKKTFSGNLLVFRWS